MQVTGALGVQRTLQDHSGGTKAVTVKDGTMRELLEALLLELRKTNLLLAEGLNVKGIDDAPTA